MDARIVAPALVLVATTVVAVAGLSLEAAGIELGTPLPPLSAAFDPAATAWVIAAAAVLALGVGLTPRLLAVRAPWAFAVAILVLALALRLSVGAVRQGPSGWYVVFDSSFEAKNEYLPALPALDHGLGWFLDRFAELVPALPVHAAGHPPGLLTVMHMAGVDTPQALAALTIGVGVLSAPLTYVLGRTLLGDERRARIAGLLWAFAPSALLYGVTSADALFATVGLAAALGLVARSPLWRAAGAAMLAVASFFSWALLASGAWAVLVLLRRDGLRVAALWAVACGGAVLVFYAALYAVAGYDPLGTLAATEEVYRFSIARLRPYAYWLFGSPAGFVLALGPPIAWYATRAAAERRAAALALVAIVVASAVLGFTKAEVERIWLPFVALACLAAAQVLPARRLTLVLALLAAQALVTELLLGTVW